MRRSVLLLVALAASVVACASAGDADAGASAVAEQAYRGVCAAAGEAAAGHERAARTAFADEAHGALHELADSLPDDARAVEGALLEAKGVVEAGRHAGAAALADDLERLGDAVVDAAAALGVDLPADCQR